MVSLVEGGEKTVGIKLYLAGSCREDVLVIKDEVGSVDSLEREYRSNTWCFVYEYGMGGEQALKFKM